MEETLTQPVLFLHMRINQPVQKDTRENLNSEIIMPQIENYF